MGEISAKSRRRRSEVIRPSRSARCVRVGAERRRAAPSGASSRHGLPPARTVDEPLLRPASRACRRCRGPARRPAAARASPPPCARAPRSGRSTVSAAARGTTTTPSSSAMMRSPGWTSWPAHTIGTFTEPSVSLTVPWAETALRPDREAHLGQRRHVAHPGLDHEAQHAARRQRAGQQLAEIAGVAGRGGRDHQHVARLGTARRRRAASSCRRAGSRP